MPAELRNPVHQDIYWKDHCRDEILREARWKATYGKFMVGEEPKYREIKEAPLRTPARGRLSLSYDEDINLDLADRFIQRHSRVPQLFSHHVYPKLQSYQVELPERPLRNFQYDSHLRNQSGQKFEELAPALPRTENARVGWLARLPVDSFPGIGKPARRVRDLAKTLGIPYEAW